MSRPRTTRPAQPVPPPAARESLGASLRCEKCGNPIPLDDFEAAQIREEWNRPIGADPYTSLGWRKWFRRHPDHMVRGKMIAHPEGCTRKCLCDAPERGADSDDPRDQRVREAIAWPLARFFWLLRLDRIGNHFEDVAWCGKRWLR